MIKRNSSNTLNYLLLVLARQHENIMLVIIVWIDVPVIAKHSVSIGLGCLYSIFSYYLSNCTTRMAWMIFKKKRFALTYL